MTHSEDALQAHSNYYGPVILPHISISTRARFFFRRLWQRPETLFCRVYGK